MLTPCSCTCLCSSVCKQTQDESISVAITVTVTVMDMVMVIGLRCVTFGWVVMVSSWPGSSWDYPADRLRGRARNRSRRRGMLWVKLLWLSDGLWYRLGV